MAASAVTLYSNALLSIGKAQQNLLSDTYVVVLLSASYTPAPNTDSTYANVSTYEISGTGYTAGGMALTSQTFSLSGGTVTFTAANTSWPSSTITAQYAAIIHRAGASIASTDLLLGYTNLNSGGSPISTTSGTFQIIWNASGIFTLTHTP